MMELKQFSKKYSFKDWPNLDIPLVTAGVYVIWDAKELIYCGMSGREIEKHTYTYSKHERLEYQYALVESSSEAFAAEKLCRDGTVFGVKPYLNPLI